MSELEKTPVHESLQEFAERVLVYGFAAQRIALVDGEIVVTPGSAQEFWSEGE